MASQLFDLGFLTLAGPPAKITFDIGTPVTAGAPFNVRATVRDANGLKVTS